MNLLAEEKIVWTVPAAAWARKLLKELKGIPEGSKARRRDEILKELPLLTQYRLTLVTVTMREEAQRETLLTNVREWFESKYGISATNFSQWFIDTHVKGKESAVEWEKGAKLTREEAFGIWSELRDIADWATVMVCLRLVEKRQVPMQDADDSDAEWHETPIPPEWKDYQTFLDTFPRPLFTTATAICNDLNPGVWAVPMDEDSKNVGGVNVRG